MTKDIVVLGGTGFVGRYFAAALAKHAIPARFLVHRAMPQWDVTGTVRLTPVRFGDLAVLRPHFRGASTIVNLIRPDGSGQRLALLRELLPVIAEAGPSRLLHCSSIDVFGEAADAIVTEETAPRPTTPYAREHLAIERLLETFPYTVIVRLGAVFGDGGVNLVSIARETAKAGRLRLGLRRSLSGQRRMHLTSVASVSACLTSLSVAASVPPLLLLTEDEDERNRLSFVQDTLLAAAGRQPLGGLPQLPVWGTELLMKLRRRPHLEVRRRYLSGHPEVLQSSKADFGEELTRYAAHLMPTFQ
jgi:nucleoside-diphosphate-sugar epimerase